MNRPLQWQQTRYALPDAYTKLLATFRQFMVPDYGVGLSRQGSGCKQRGTWEMLHFMIDAHARKHPTGQVPRQF